MSSRPGSIGPGRPVRGSTTGRPIMALLDLAGRRWTLRILWELTEAGRPLTFRDLRERCAQMSSSVLTRRLAELREVQLVTHTDTGYILTPLGDDLVERLQPLSEWSRTWAQHLDQSSQESDA
ncbi:MAG: helix-turn-helix domain-containing protein [Acidimicrobiia bacterium]